MSHARTLARRGADETGSALFVAMIAMSLMLMMGLATVALTDQQTRQSGVERVRESSFNLAEGALQQQSYLLGGKGWPKRAIDALPDSCSQASTSTRCPTPSALVTSTGAGAYQGIDYANGAVWTTYVRDNTVANPRQYTSAVDSQPRWDADGNGEIWVRSTATVSGKTRVLVALLKRDPIPILMPKAVLVAGSLAVGQNGQSPVITSDATTLPVLRCDPATTACADYIQSGDKKDPQISPDTVTYNPSFPPLVPADTVEKLVESTTAFTSCPTEAQVAATEIVVIDVPESTKCTFTGNTVYYSPSKPGIIIMRRGTLDMAGTGRLYGMLLHLNEANRVGTPACIQVTGTFDIQGGVAVEGLCGFYIQGNARLAFSPNNLNFSVTGVAGLVQNTWRELPVS
jgi:Tfp pilus assembly protein PilX